MSYVLEILLTYQFWKTIQDKFSTITPGKAIARLFIPFYNIYWFFHIFLQLPKEMNRFISHSFNEKANLRIHRPKGWIVTAYFGFIIIGGALYLVILRSVSESANALTSSSQLAQLMQPVVFSAGVYNIVSWILFTAMFIDFYLTTRSILKAEEQK
jgi:hypothetical protein